MTEVEKSQLDQLAERINKHHRQVETAVGRALDHARLAGKFLVEAKEQVRHGVWLPWLESNFEGSERMAQMYMRVHSRWADIEANTKSVSDLTLSGALKSIAAPAPVVTLEPLEGGLTRPRVERSVTRSGPSKRFLGMVESSMAKKPAELGATDTGEKTVLQMYAEHGKLPTEGSEIMGIVRAGVMEYVVEYTDGKRHTVLRRVLLESGWKKCDCCQGYGIVEK